MKYCKKCADTLLLTRCYHNSTYLFGFDPPPSPPKKIERSTEKKATFVQAVTIFKNSIPEATTTTKFLY